MEALKNQTVDAASIQKYIKIAQQILANETIEVQKNLTDATKNKNVAQTSQNQSAYEAWDDVENAYGDLLDVVQLYQKVVDQLVYLSSIVSTGDTTNIQT